VADLGTKLTLVLLESSLIGAIRGVTNCFGAEKLSYLIENGWYVVGSIFYGASGAEIGGDDKLPLEEAERVSQARGFIVRTVLPILNQLKGTASRFPPGMVQEKISPGWLKAKGKGKFPLLLSVVERHGAAGEVWLGNQCAELSDWVLSRSIYSPIHRRMISVREQAELDELAAWIKQSIQTEQPPKKVLEQARAILAELKSLKEQGLQQASRAWA